MRLLVAYSLDSCFTKTVVDYIDAIRKYSVNDVYYINVTEQMPPSATLDDYDAVFHTYSARLVYDNVTSNEYLEQLSRFNGLKMLSVQDEYDRTHRLKEAIKRFGFDVVLTCVPKAFVDAVYPKSEFPNVCFESVLTGYVPVSDVERDYKAQPIAERPIAIGYRGRDIGGRYGRLGWEKFEIGRRMKQICDARGIANDIAMDEASRIYGEKWLRFVGSCRTMLGSESGSNIFDFDGTIEGQFEGWINANGRRPSYAEFRPYTDHLESRVEMGQISPRIFECALMRTPMILFRGRYSDAVEADEHYIPLEKDFSNIDKVLLKLNDIERLENLAERAYSHLVASGKFGYPSFVARLDSILSQHEKRGCNPTPCDKQAAAFNKSTDTNSKDYAVAVTRVPIDYDEHSIKLNASLLHQSAETVTAYIGSVKVFKKRLSSDQKPSNDTEENIEQFSAALRKASQSLVDIRKQIVRLESADRSEVGQDDLNFIYTKSRSILSELYKINHDLAEQYNQIDRDTLIGVVDEQVGKIQSLLDHGEKNISGYVESVQLFEDRLAAVKKQREDVKQQISEFAIALKQASGSFAAIHKEIDSVLFTDLAAVGQANLNLLYGECQSTLSKLVQINDSLREKHHKLWKSFKHPLVRAVSSLRLHLTQQWGILSKVGRRVLPLK